MVFIDPVSWPCDICKKRRTESYLWENARGGEDEVGNKIRFAVRYCNDNPTCREKAAERVKKWAKSLYK